MRRGATIAYASIDSKLNTVHQAMLEFMGHAYSGVPKLFSDDKEAGLHARSLVIADRVHYQIWLRTVRSGWNRECTLARYYRCLYEKIFEISDAHTLHQSPADRKKSSDMAAKSIRAALKPLFVKNLLLERSEEGSGEKGSRYEDCFLCAEEMKNEDLPWDLSERDW